MLDQLIGGAGPDGVTYALASGLLGYTPDALLDDVIEAFAAGDGASVFAVVDRVIETGQDPRRFTEDLLRRLRDLVIISAVPDAPATGLIDVAEDAGERLVAQAARFGATELSRAADLVANGLTEMRGATAPAAAARADLRAGAAARRRPRHRRDDGPARAPRAPGRHRWSRERYAAAPTAAAPASRRPHRAAAPVAVEPTPEPAPEPVPSRPEPTPGADAGAHARARRPSRRRQPTPDPSPTAAPAGGLTLVDVRRLWPDIVEAVKSRRRLTWIHLTQHAQVVAVDGTTLTLGFSNAGARESFDGGGSAEIVRQAAIDVVGSDWKVETIVDPGAQPSATQSPVTPAPTPERAHRRPSPRSRRRTGSTGATPSTTDPAAVAAAREAIQQTRVPGKDPADDPRAAADAEAHPDDDDVDSSALAGAELLQQHLGAEVIEEIKHH